MKFETKTTQQFGGVERLWSKCTISCHKLSIQENEIWKNVNALHFVDSIEILTK